MPTRVYSRRTLGVGEVRIPGASTKSLKAAIGVAEVRSLPYRSMCPRDFQAVMTAFWACMGASGPVVIRRGNMLA